MPIIDPAAALPDILDHGLRVVFCGINPGLDAAAAGHHFVGRGNRFWPVLHQAGFTPHQLAPRDDRSVLGYGLGLTVAVARPSRGADEIPAGEFAQSAGALLDKLARYQPDCIAFLGKAAYQGISGRRQLAWGEQAERLGGARVWLLPNPSGLNRSFTRARLIDAYAALRRALPAA